MSGLHRIPSISCRGVAVAAAALLLAAPAIAQQGAARPDSLTHYELPDVVVTATRGLRYIREIPVPTEVVMNDDVAARGSLRLAELLDEQAGLSLVHEFGAGVQMQGLNSDYVLVLLDGEPVIGRSGGTLDLDRLTVHGLDRIEIVRGPSSSLYGSDALAGVINLITRENSSPFSASTKLHYETNSTADLSVSTEFTTKRIDGSLLLNRYSSGGYDLFQDQPGQTVPGFTDYSASGRLSSQPHPDTRLRLAGRFGRLDQKDDIGLSYTAGTTPIVSIGERTEWSVTGGIDQKVSEAISVDGSLYASRFVSTTTLDLAAVNAAGGESRFDQFYGEAEIKAELVTGASQLITVGAGAATESVDADRIIGRSQSARSLFGYAQHWWAPVANVNLIVGARYDAHTDYNNRLSPKTSLLYKPVDNLHLRVSIGSGFKAPTFQQRYLDFSNPIGGYSIYGASGADSELRALEESGQIRRYTSGVQFGSELQPEHSWSYNVGADWYASPSADLRINFFHNRISDLIETLLIAEKVSGQQIFSYANLDRIRTRGAEINLGLSPRSGLRLEMGYQFVDTADLDVIEALNDGAIYKRVNGRDRAVRKDEYGGLFQRSKHSASVNLRYRVSRSGTTTSLRATYKNRYGLFDRNGNLILDDDSEYVPGYMLWNVTLTQPITDRVQVQAGAKNLFNYTNAALIPALPGRLVFGGVQLRTH